MVAEEVRLLGIELEEANSKVVIAECTAENRVEAEQRKCREELATVQQLCRGEAYFPQRLLPLFSNL